MLCYARLYGCVGTASTGFGTACSCLETFQKLLVLAGTHTVPNWLVVVYMSAFSAYAVLGFLLSLRAHQCPVLATPAREHTQAYQAYIGRGTRRGSVKQSQYQLVLAFFHLTRSRLTESAFAACGVSFIYSWEYAAPYSNRRPFTGIGAKAVRVSSIAQPCLGIVERALQCTYLVGRKVARWGSRRRSCAQTLMAVVSILRGKYRAFA